MCAHKPQPEDFDNPDVLNAVNPHPKWGYVYGPIRNQNPAWIPLPRGENIHRELAQNERTLMLFRKPPGQPLNLLAQYGGLTCDVQVDETQMCGKTFQTAKAFNNHTWRHHPGCFIPFRVTSSKMEASHAAENIMKRWILTGGWRDAFYLYEPGRCYSKGSIGRMCDELEEIAASDSAFANKWGTRFHRWHTGTKYQLYMRAETKETPGSLS